MQRFRHLLCLAIHLAGYTFASTCLHAIHYVCKMMIVWFVQLANNHSHCNKQRQQRSIKTRKPPVSLSLSLQPLRRVNIRMVNVNRLVHFHTRAQYGKNERLKRTSNT